MLGSKLFVCNLLVWLATSSKLLIRAEGRWSNAQIGLNETKDLNIIPGIECFLANDVIVVNVKMRDLLRGIYTARCSRIPFLRKTERFSLL